MARARHRQTLSTLPMKKTLLSLILLILAAIPVAASEYLCRNISLDEGLSQSNVTALARDGRGFLWIGTRFGLNRYDFERVVNYYHDPTDPNSLPNNSICALYTDSRGRLWVACEYGVAYYDELSNSFIQLRIDGRQLGVRSFYEESDGLLMGGPGELYYYDYATGAVAPLQVKGGSKVYYTAIHRRSTDFYILITRWDGAWIFDRTHATISRLDHIPEKGIMASTVDTRGNLWISPYGEGITAYDRAGTKLFTLTTANSTLSSDIILDITDHDGRIWLATDGGGISIYDPETGQIDNSATITPLRTLGAVTVLYRDLHGDLYAGTVRGGAIAIRPVAMHTFQESRETRFSAITSLCLDNEGIIWLGDDGNGVLRYDPEKESLTGMPATARLKVTDLEEHDADHLLLATFDKGFMLFNKRTHQLEPAPQSLQKFFTEQSKRAVPISLRRLSDNMIAILSDHIVTYNPQDRSVDTLATRNANAPHGALMPFFNEGGRLMAAGYTFISEFDPVTGVHSELLHLDDSEHIYSAAFDGMRTVYIGTADGILCHDLTTGETTPMPGIKGRVCALALEGRGRLWIGTNRTLYLKHLDSGNLTVFGNSDGVTANEYQPNATLIAPGKLFMGGVYGLLRVNTNEIQALLTTQPDPVVSLSDVQIDGVSAYSHIRDGKLEVSDRHAGVTLSVIDNGSSSPRAQLFRYEIIGGGTNKTIETIARTIELNFLNAGQNYEVLMATNRPDGTWSRPEKLVTLAVLAPWYKSGWTWTLGAIFVIGSFIYWSWRRERRQKQRITTQMEAYRSNTLEREVAFLVNTNYALRTPLTLIYAPVKLLLEQLHSGHHVELIPALEGIYRNTKKMRDTIDMALELHHVSSTPEKTQLTTHDISRSIDDVLAANRGNLDLKHIKVNYRPSQEMFPAVYDRDRLALVIETLLRNAVQRSAEHATIDIRAVMEGDYIRVSISDSGEYLDDQTLGELFSKYFNDDNAKFGNSLGFAYAKNIIDLQGGHIGAENNVGVPGLTVWFEFPAAGAPAAEAYTKRRRNETTPAPAAVEVAADIDTSDLTAIVVEEDNDLCMFVAQQLSMYFGRVLHAFNGKDALLLIRQYQPDIVISSVMLPIKSGLELCRTVKTSPETSHIPVILLTAIKEGSALENGYGAGADSYLSKPFDVNVLLTRCRNILHTRSVIRNRYASPEAASSSKKQMANADETFILKVNRIITDNISNPEFSVDTVVELMASSRSALYSKFKEISGMTIGAYIADYRLRRAKELLLESSLSVSEISEMLGFSSQRYFSTFFKERTGMSPSTFRSTQNASEK